MFNVVVVVIAASLVLLVCGRADLEPLFSRDRVRRPDRAFEPDRHQRHRRHLRVHSKATSANRRTVLCLGILAGQIQQAGIQADARYI